MLKLVEEYKGVLSSTVELRVQRYKTMTALKEVSDDVVKSLETRLKDTSTSLSDKYRILFSLRNIKGESAHKAMLTGALHAQKQPPVLGLTLGF